MTFDAKALSEIGAGLVMLIGLLGVLANRAKQDKGFTVLAIQFTSIILVIPSILILSLEGVLKGETTATLLGALAGYLFSEIGKSQKGSASSGQVGSTADASESYLDHENKV